MPRRSCRVRNRSTAGDRSTTEEMILPHATQVEIELSEAQPQTQGRLTRSKHNTRSSASTSLTVDEADVEQSIAEEAASLVFSVPSTTAAALANLAPNSPTPSETHPVYAKKSKPALNLGPNERLRWLSFPNRVLNTVKAEEELAGVNYVPGTKFEEHENTRSTVDHPFEDSDDGWETMSETESGGEWEEQLIYVELDDVPSVQELFAVQPDDFLRFQRKRFRKKAEPVKATHPKVTLKFHQFESSSPVLQIGNRYFSCKWEEPTGTGMFFRKKADAPTVSVKQEAKSDNRSRPSSTLRNIVPDPSIPWDNVFGGDRLITRNTYELVALADKVLKTQMLEADTKKLNRLPTNRQFFGRPGSFKIPQGYTATNLLAGEYKPRRTYTRRRKDQKPEEISPIIKMDSSSAPSNEKEQVTSEQSATDVEMSDV